MELLVLIALIVYVIGLSNIQCEIGYQEPNGNVVYGDKQTRMREVLKDRVNRILTVYAVTGFL